MAREKPDTVVGRVDHTEKALVQAAARQQRISVSRFVHAAVMAAARQVLREKLSEA